MPDENGTETTRTEALGGNESPFADTPDDSDVTVIDGGNSGEENGQNPEGSADAGEKVTPSEDLKVVVSIRRGARATIGVQQASSDPHIESFDDCDLPGLAQEVIAVTERARARWEEDPKYPAYERPAPPARRRSRRGQGAAQTPTAESEETQQQTLRLF